MPSLSDWSAAAIAQLQGGTVRAGIYFRVATDPVIRIWGGVGRKLIDADLVETDGTQFYEGFGELAGALPQLTALINGEADRADFKISGAAVTPDVAQLAGIYASTIRKAPVNLGLRVMDLYWQDISPTAWLWDGTADSLQIDYANAAEGPVRTLTLSVGSLLTGRRRPSPSYWTNPDQQTLSSGDRFCERVDGYNIGSTLPWPK